VLRVGGVGVHRDRARAELLDEPRQRCAAPRFVAQPLLQNLPDPCADHRVRQQVAFEELVT